MHTWAINTAVNTRDEILITNKVQTYIYVYIYTGLPQMYSNRCAKHRISSRQTVREVKLPVSLYSFVCAQNYLAPKLQLRYGSHQMGMYEQNLFFFMTKKHSHTEINNQLILSK